jgi:cellulose synthase/poly-beta-1,6-N-acetylglucosamine synthase-like glycosyltransferase
MVNASLSTRLSAYRLLERGQIGFAIGVVACAFAIASTHALFGFGPPLVTYVGVIVALFTILYATVMVFRSILILAGRNAKVVQFSHADIHAIPDRDLPTYSVLVPLYREGRVLPELLEHLSRLSYPRDKLQIILLIEADDFETRNVLATLALAPQFEAVTIAPGYPRTKPKALNVGLARAVGEFCVIFDAEARPDLDQLRKAVAAFGQLPQWVVCIQAELQYWNPWTNWLTRCFSAEYAVHFSLVLRGLDRLRLPIPLGGTSNHFRTSALRELGGWDAYNVTEDADLGIRIARRGWAVRMMSSVTEEEANSQLGSWLRQRSRWIKGYMQTWLVHMRSPIQLWRELGTRQFLSLQLTLGFFTVTTVINPVFWLLTVLYLATGPRYVGALFPTPTLYLGITCLAVGNLLMVYYLMIGCMERGLHRAVRAMLFVPIYWALISAAAYRAIFQLARTSRRHYWELTEHGLDNTVRISPGSSDLTAANGEARSQHSIDGCEAGPELVVGERESAPVEEARQ